MDDMRPIRAGDRGPAVEDIQRRLVTLGHDLGPTGVDGVFLGATLGAVRDFQHLHDLAEDGMVGPETWSALVDATFRLGDRLLYLRFPYLHGFDVRTLQGALNALGFTCGEPDGIFGAFTERAVREFQLNSGLPLDGIVGGETARAVMNLRHVWSQKEPVAPVALRTAPARAADVLASARVALVPEDAVGSEVAGRLVNLAIAARSDAALSIVLEGPPPEDTRVVLRLVSFSGVVPEDAEVPFVVLSPERESSLAARLVAALSASSTATREVAVGIDASAEDGERTLQRAAVGLLDALCSALAGQNPSVLP